MGSTNTSLVPFLRGSWSLGSFLQISVLTVCSESMGSDGQEAVWCNVGALSGSLLLEFVAKKSLDTDLI